MCDGLFRFLPPVSEDCVMLSVKIQLSNCLYPCFFFFFFLLTEHFGGTLDLLLWASKSCRNSENEECIQQYCGEGSQMFTVFSLANVERKQEWDDFVWGLWKLSLQRCRYNCLKCRQYNIAYAKPNDMRNEMFYPKPLRKCTGFKMGLSILHHWIQR